jgi:hypothetical protein
VTAVDTNVYFTVTPRPQRERYENAFYAIAGATIVADDALRADPAIARFITAGATHLKTPLQDADADLVIRLLTADDDAPADLPAHPRAYDPEGYVLVVRHREDHVEAVIRGNRAAGVRHGLQSLRQLIVRWSDQTVVREATLVDWPDVRHRFVKRASGYWMGQAAGYKLNGATIPAGGEADITVDDTVRARLKHTADRAADHGLGLLGMVSMGNMYRGDKAAVQRRVDLFVAMYEAGYTHLAMMNDDKMTLADAEAIRRWDSYDNAQLYYLKTVRKALRSAGYRERFGFMPNHYTGKQVHAHTVDVLRGKLSDDTAFFWAGDYQPGMAATIPHLTHVRDQVDAKHLWYYTNWPQVSGPWFTENFGACRVQEYGAQGLVDLVTVSTSNPPRVFPSSFITVADLLWNAEGYDPDRSLLRATKELVDPASFPAFYALFKYLDRVAPGVEARHFGPMYAADAPADRRAIIEERCRQMDRLAAACLKTPAGQEAKAKKVLEGMIGRRDRDLKRLAAEQARETDVGNSKHIGCARLTAVPKLDGDATEAAWQAAAVGTGFTDLRGNKPAPHGTTLKVMRDDTHLYVAVVCDETHLQDPTFLDPGHTFPAPISKHSDGYLWWYESIELFFDPGRDRRDVRQIMLNPWGMKECFQYTTVRYGYYGIEDQVRTNWPVNGAASRTDDTWTVEVAIPLAIFGVDSVAAGDEWGFNVARNRRLRVGDGMKYSTWTPLGWGFQDARNFGTLAFE